MTDIIMNKQKILLSASTFAIGAICGILGTRALTPVTATAPVAVPEASKASADTPATQDVDRFGQPFVAAVPAEQVRPEPQQVIMEEVRGEDGLTGAERIERFKLQHPDEFREMMTKREDRQREKLARQAARQEFLDTIDTSLFTEEQRKLHRDYSEAMAERDRCKEIARQAMAAHEEIPLDVRNRLQEAERTLLKSAKSEREALLQATARALGVKEEALEEFTTTVGTIYDTTETRRKSLF